MEVSEVRRLLRTAIEDARRRAAARRARREEAARDWERVLPDVAVPAFHMMASALTGEGHRFKVLTPGTVVRLAPERGGEESVELALVTDRDEPALMLTTTRGRGRRVVTSERVLREGDAIGSIGEADIIVAVLAELVPLLER